MSAVTKTTVCDAKLHLLEKFLEAASALAAVQNEQVKAVIDGDSEFSRFDVLLHIAGETKRRAKYAYLSHVETHGC